MSHITKARTARRLSVLAGLSGASLAASLAFAVPAAAHVEVEAEGAAALAQNVTLDFSAESESDSAGISRMEVILPEGILPSDVTFKQGPDGWKFATTPRGYTVSGPAVGVGDDVEYSVTVRQLPDAESLAFKTLQTYGDGRVDRWIELEESGGGEGDGHSHGHGNPAPQLALKPAAPGAKPVAPSPSAVAPEQSPAKSPEKSTGNASGKPATGNQGPESAQDAGEGGSSPVPALVIGAVVLAAVAGGGYWWKRRGAAS
ncbi:DUF1775 domain-containing protein [Streptomyces sp. SCSIO 30461]|uniref:DUF1775 domain-containing protein n=1 Tax=Streptomyces sp. SCSIO 30461 TaxID=3118085 RepID=UPI0030D4E973